MRAHALHVLTVRGCELAEICVFMAPALFAAFGLPEVC
jgi:hypothetical protein